MIGFLKVLFGAIFLFMIGMTVHTSLQSNLFTDWPRLLAEPWAVATLWDAYFGFTTFYVWVFYKESSAARRAVLFVLIMLLGNIAMSFYVLIQLFKLPPDSGARELLLKRPAA